MTLRRIDAGQKPEATVLLIYQGKTIVENSIPTETTKEEI